MQTWPGSSTLCKVLHFTQHPQCQDAGSQQLWKAGSWSTEALAACWLVPCQRSQTVAIAWCTSRNRQPHAPAPKPSSASQPMRCITCSLAFTTDTKLLTCNEKFSILSSVPKVKSTGEKKKNKLVYYSSKKMGMNWTYAACTVTGNMRALFLNLCSPVLIYKS